MEGWFEVMCEASEAYFNDVNDIGLSDEVDKMPVFVQHLYENMAWSRLNK